MFESEVFNRTSSYNEKEIGAGTYNFIIGIILLWGFVINWLMVTSIPPEVVLSVSPFVLFIGYFVSCFLGIYLFSSSDSPVVSFLGYNFVVVPFGLILNIAIAPFDPSLVMDAIKVTGLVTASMMILGTLFPAFFARIAGALSIALLIVIIIECVQMFILKIDQGWTDWVVVGIFCGYIGYDWGRANQIPKTVDNAIDSAASLYMDIINLFLRILRIMARNK